MLTGFFFHFGRYTLLLKSMWKRPENGAIYWQETMRQMVSLGVGSLVIVFIISVFMGAVTTVQTAYQLVSGFIPRSIIGSIVSDSSILELAPTITSLVLAGKIGSNMASEIGTMRVTEQIDALEIMGVNAPGYLLMPRIVSALIMVPLLIMLSTALCIGGGILAGHLSGIIESSVFIDGARSTFKAFNVGFAMSKAITYGFMISSISCYQGYYTEGGALEVGKSSTKAVVFSCILILLSDYILAQLIL